MKTGKSSLGLVTWRSLRGLDARSFRRVAAVGDKSPGSWWSQTMNGTAMQTGLGEACNVY